MVEEVVVLHVDEELRGGRMGVLCARHGDCPALVLQPVVGFILDRCLRRLLLHVRGKTAALNHKVIDDPMKNSTVIEAASHV